MSGVPSVTARPITSIATTFFINLPSLGSLLGRRGRPGTRTFGASLTSGAPSAPRASPASGLTLEEEPLNQVKLGIGQAIRWRSAFRQCGLRARSGSSSSPAAPLRNISPYWLNTTALDALLERRSAECRRATDARGSATWRTRTWGPPSERLHRDSFLCVVTDPRLVTPVDIAERPPPARRVDGEGCSTSGGAG